jgi:hypothetical protein
MRTSRMLMEVVTTIRGAPGVPAAGPGFAEGDPSPCCHDERLVRDSREPSLLVCPECGTLYLLAG